MSFEEKQLPAVISKDEKIFKFCSSQVGYNSLNETAKEFYYLVNLSRSNPRNFLDSIIAPIVKLYPQLNGEFYSSLKTDLSSVDSLPLLKLNKVLIQMAKNHSIDITSHNNAPSHNSSDGETFTDRFKENDLKKCGGENISYGANSPSFLLTLLYIDLGIPSLGHRKALLNPNFTETGIGDSFFKNGSIFLVQDFACSQN